MRFLRGLLLVLATLAPLASRVAAAPDAVAPDAERDAVEALLRPGPKGAAAAPSDDALGALAADPALDPWMLVERLLERGRQDLAVRFARRTDEGTVGPLLPYAEAPDAMPGGEARARARAAALAAHAAGKIDVALGHLDALRAVAGRTSVFGAEAAALRGDWLATTDRRAEGIEAWLSGAEEALRIGWWSGAERFFTRAVTAAYLARSLDLLQRALEGTRALLEVRGDGSYLAAAEQNLGSVASLRGDGPGALRHFDEALSLYEAAGKGEDVAGVRSLRSRALADLGDFRAAIDEQRALASYFADRPQDAAWAANQIELGTIRNRLGDEPGALAALEGARDAYHARDDREGEALAQGNLGVTHAMAGRWAEAIEAYRAALALSEASGDPVGIATAKNDVADALRRGAEADVREAELAAEPAERQAGLERAKSALADARVLAEEALRVAGGAGAAGLRCGTTHTLAEILIAEGRFGEASSLLEPARDEAARLRAWNLELSATVTLARARLFAEDWPRALREARQAAEELGRAFGGLAEEDLSRARSLTPDVYDIGVSAALRTKSVDELAYFLESGRAAALLRGLGGRAAALRASVPKELAERLVEASRAKVDAFAAWQKSRSGRLSVTRDLWDKYEEARRVEQKTLEETADAQTTAAGRLAPSRLVSIADLRARLRGTARPGLRQVFALFNFQGGRAAALLVEDSGARVVEYAARDLATLRAAFDTLSASRDGALDPDALGVVRRLLIDPLKIPAGPTRLFVSPDRDLAYLPLSVIVPDDWEIVWEPSATTYDLLAERRLRKGQAILGVGDPDYHTAPNPDALTTRGGPRLTPLPGTRVEIESIAGRAEDRRLLGAQATERGLYRALEAAGSDRPWRSVHLACHGLVDVEWPALSCLAITPGDGEDGFLTSSEVLRLPLRTDLTVLSACQTGRGKFVRGEGVMSLTRAFMFAGAARVIVSLWDVEDAATAFLMQAFYREWNAGRGTAQALRLAQLAVRDREVEETVTEPGKPPEARKRRPWADPRYWGAWVLWGLPD